MSLTLLPMKLVTLLFLIGSFRLKIRKSVSTHPYMRCTRFSFYSRLMVHYPFELCTLYHTIKAPGAHLDYS